MDPPSLISLSANRKDATTSIYSTFYDYPHYIFDALYVILFVIQLQLITEPTNYRKCDAGNKNKYEKGRCKS